MWTDTTVGAFGSRSSHRRIALLAAALVTIAMAIPALTGPPLYEDPHYLSAPRVWRLTPRTLTNLSLAGSPPLLAHVGNLALHLTTSALLLLLLTRWSTPLWSLALTLIFLWHPAQAEAVYYISGRGDLIAGVGVVCALLAYEGISDEVTACYVITIAGLVAMAAKDVSALGLIGILPLCGWLCPRESPDRRVWLPSVCWTIAAALVLWKSPLRPTLAAYSWIAAQVGQMWHLLRIVVWPVGQSIEAPILPDWQGPLGIIAAVGLLLTAFSDDRFRRGRFVACWLVLAFVPRLLLDQLGPTPEPLHEHHLYVPLMGIVLGVGLR